MCALVLVLRPQQDNDIIDQIKGFPCVSHVTVLPTEQPTKVCAVVDILTSRCPDYYIQQFTQRFPGIRVSLGVQPL